MNWDNLGDFQTGVVGVTQLPVPKPTVPPILNCVATIYGGQ